MEILITGINGFVGKILYKSLQERGHEVYGIDIQGDDHHIIQLDITDRDKVFECLADISPDFIFHLAAISKVNVNTQQNIFNINVNGTLNLLSASTKLKKMPKILFASSSQVYGIVDKAKQPIAEEIPVKPVNMYGASKAAAENIVMAFHCEFGLPFVIARPFNHTGRGQALDFIVPKLIQAFKDKKSEIRLGNTQIYRDFLDVRDVIDAYVKIMNDFHAGEVYNISSGKIVHLSELISIIGDISGHNLKIISDKELFRKNEIEYAMGDSSKIIKELGWSPNYELAETLRWMLGHNA